ncbi:MAG: methyltransferase domain-containing protein [Chloroflexota bacterium]|nr:methyltransferase domain-containing protein [Chloroflexota bacterium]
MSEEAYREESNASKSLVRELFTRKTQDYAGSSLLVNSDNLDAVIQLSQISSNDRVLDVATGTGFMAKAMSGIGADVLATDFTISMLEKAREGIGDCDNAAFALADAECLPFADASFDVIACRVAIHHFANPQIALREMARVCKPGGRVVIMDVVSSEDESRSELHNRIGKMRDSSEVRQWRCSELEQMLRDGALDVSTVDLWPHLMAFDEWIRLGGADAETALEVKRMVIDSMEGDKAGLSPEFRNGELYFTWTTAILIANK